MLKQGKKYKAALAKVDLEKNYPPEEAVALAKETAYTKFDASAVRIWTSTLASNFV